MHQITYGIFKTYKGIFKKKHIGNTQLLFFSTDTKFIILSLLGKLKDGKHAAQMILRGSVDQFTPILDFYKSQKNFMLLETLSCKSIETENGSYIITLPKKEKYIRSNLKIDFQQEYSKGNQFIFFIDAKLALVTDIDISSPTEVKMAATKQQAKLMNSITKLKSRIKR